MKPNTLIKYMTAVLTVALSPLAHATQVPGVAEQPDSYFYTGKPYDADLGGYTFAARTYDPEINRWTSADPSGFPDGANCSSYAPVPGYELDPTGAFKVTVTDINKSKAQNATYNNVTYIVTPTTATSLGVASSGDLDLIKSSYSQYNYSSASSPIQGTSYDVEFKAGTYHAIASGGVGKLAMSGYIYNLPTLSAGETYKWIQIVSTNDPGSGHTANVYVDDTLPDGSTTGTAPFYPRTVTQYDDTPYRLFSDIDAKHLDGITWTASLYLAKLSGNNVTLYDGMSWGFSITKE